MPIARLRFSVRTLLIAVTVVGSVLGMSIRFAPHVAFKLFGARATGIIPIPTQPLLATVPNERLVKCQVGPISFEMPKALSNSVTVNNGSGKSTLLQFRAGDRRILGQIVGRDALILPPRLVNFPEKAKLRWPRLRKEILAVQPSDFSWGMSHRELEWHQWLLSTRARLTAPIDSVEHFSRPDIDGILVWFPSHCEFQFGTCATVDEKWLGNISFIGISANDRDWIRHLCSTLAVNEDPESFNMHANAAIKAVITTAETAREGDPSPRSTDEREKELKALR